MASFGLTTSQFVTAPKRTQGQTVIKVCLTTSQFVTAPKHEDGTSIVSNGLTTSQFVTAPKPRIEPCEALGRLTTSQFVTAPKQRRSLCLPEGWFDYQSVCHCSKTVGAKSSLQEDGQADWRASS